MMPTYYNYVYSRQKSLFGSFEVLQKQVMTFFLAGYSVR